MDAVLTKNCSLMGTDLPWGLNRGHPTTVIAKVPKPSNRKGKQSARSAFVKSVVREVRTGV
jgi:large subunit ribosomal protein L36e